jgi:hypothetical protein
MLVTSAVNAEPPQSSKSLTLEERNAIATKRAPKGERPFVRYDRQDPVIQAFLSLSIQCYSGDVDPEGKALNASMLDYMTKVGDGASGSPLTATYELKSDRDPVTNGPVVSVRAIYYELNGNIAFPFAMMAYYAVDGFGAEYRAWDVEDLVTGTWAESPPDYAKASNPLRDMRQGWMALCNVLLWERRQERSGR